MTEILWPIEMGVAIDNIDVDGKNMVICAHGTQRKACCTKCGTESSRGNSHYRRHPVDLPCGGYGVRLILTVPRFFCDNKECKRRTFAATFPALVARFARRTDRLMQQQRHVGYAVSAEQGARLMSNLSIETSADTIIRLVRDTPEFEPETPRVLGVDDWAKCKGQTYGTILVDLERRQVIDLLDERSAGSLANWLQEHPGVEIITRDRGTEFIDGATAGAPEAMQIADRFHLLQNLVDALKRMFGEWPSKLREAAHQVAQEMQTDDRPETETTSLLESTCPSPEVDSAQPGKRTLSELQFAEVKELQRQGWSQRAIATHLHIHRRTVARYCALDSYPPRMPPAQSTSRVLPYLAYLTKRWAEGCNNIVQLHAELQGLGFDGHYTSVYRIVKQLRQGNSLSNPAAPVPVTIPRLSATEAAWLLVHPDDRLNDIQLRLREKLGQISKEFGTASELAQSFVAMVRNRTATAFDAWLERAESSSLKIFTNFAASLRRDYAAVKAALTYHWSNGQVEGQVNRLKLIKRKMYGRAKFDLLRKHVLGMPAAR